MVQKLCGRPLTFGDREQIGLIEIQRKKDLHCQLIKENADYAKLNEELEELEEERNHIQKKLLNLEDLIAEKEVNLDQLKDKLLAWRKL